MWKVVAHVFLVIAFLSSAQFVYVVFSNKAAPSNRKLTEDGGLRACGRFYNCINSQATDWRFILPLKTGPNIPSAKQRLRETITASGGQIQRITDDYMWATFVSQNIGFVDDVEVFLDIDYGEFHIRSGSRVGYYDFGVNRARIEEIRELYKLTE